MEYNIINKIKLFRIELQNLIKIKNKIFYLHIKNQNKVRQIRKEKNNKLKK